MENASIRLQAHAAVVVLAPRVRNAAGKDVIILQLSRVVMEWSVLLEMNVAEVRVMIRQMASVAGAMFAWRRKIAVTASVIIHPARSAAETCFVPPARPAVVTSVVHRARLAAEANVTTHRVRRVAVM